MKAHSKQCSTRPLQRDIGRAMRSFKEASSGHRQGEIGFLQQDVNTTPTLY